MDEDEISYWNREGYQMMEYNASMGNKRLGRGLTISIAVKFLLSVYLSLIPWMILVTSMKYWIVMQTKEEV